VLAHLSELSRSAYVAPYNIALVHAGLGERDLAFEGLNRAYEAHSYLLAIYLNTDVRLDDLRSDARFVDLVHRVGLPETR
jgi:hypothetical protein